mgnify:FL=1
MQRPTADGIEIHHDEKRGYLELACEPDAFEEYRQVVRRHMSDFSDFDVDNVIELHISDTARLLARRRAPGSRRLGVVVGSAIIVILGLAMVGALTVFKWFLV